MNKNETKTEHGDSIMKSKEDIIAAIEQLLTDDRKLANGYFGEVIRLNTELEAEREKRKRAERIASEAIRIGREAREILSANCQLSE